MMLDYVQHRPPRHVAMSPPAPPAPHHLVLYYDKDGAV